MHQEEKKTSRREFLKNFPFGIIKEISTITQTLTRPEQDPLTRLSTPRKARLDINNCLAWSGSYCQLCYLACPKRNRAILISDLKPVIISEVCDGCGLCVDACRTINIPPAIALS